MGNKQHIFLVPGFFGFTNLGRAPYFSHVHDFLPAACAEMGLDTAIHLVDTHPTSSIRKRAERLLDQVARADGPIHLVGHSSGGLDARLLLSPQVSLQTEIDIESVASRARTVVTVSTPHHGTPLASFFTSLFGQKALQLLSLGTIYTLWFGRLPSSVLFRLGTMVTRMDRVVGLRIDVLDQLYEQLLADFSPERRQAIEQFVGDVSADQALVPQLTPEGIDVLNAAITDRPGVRYGSVINYARRPGLISTAKVGLAPYGQATHALFYAIYRLSSGLTSEQAPRLTDAQADALLHTYGMIPDVQANDGVVPTISQVWGQIIHATMADHLDVLGHFGQKGHDPPHIDWLSSGCGFDRASFEALWRDVARFIAGKQPLVARPANSSKDHLKHLFRR